MYINKNFSALTLNVTNDDNIHLFTKSLLPFANVLVIVL